MLSEHLGLIGLPTVEHLLQLGITIAVHPLIHISRRIIVQAEEFLDGGYGLGAGHWVSLLRSPYSSTPTVASVGGTVPLRLLAQGALGGSTGVLPWASSTPSPVTRGGGG